MVTLVVGRTPLHLLIASAMRHEQRRFMGRAPTIAGKKSATDAKKAILFGKLGKELVVTSKATNGDVNNIRLASVVIKAKTFNMPRDKIEAAIKRGVDGKSAAATETILYEGTGPSGSALMIEALTDNRKRTAPALRHILSKHGGALGANGSVAWMFERKGYLEVKQPEESSLTWDEYSVMNIAIEAGADDMEFRDSIAQITCDVNDLAAVRNHLVGMGLHPHVCSLIYNPKEFVTLPEDASEEFEALLDALSDNEDVNDVFHNIHQ
ncbi:hypothetical protein H310_04678 [Aphanomyces invadans]|uniref:Transcriptional regulatory protein n=1 Tax=Aphanomyces invadans TaxID=157072 RepID=A0A024UDE6_9STRA|nr:hypothetical protein H310_04678 [Aphanomyces invadans]ETW04396.1 hypothetical protein H310_04678 [Aphanomyces invadans]|eukprot:XP_008867352.1 hypothetical protein H310_04678 [Aphanomyces invadans]